MPIPDNQDRSKRVLADPWVHRLVQERDIGGRLVLHPLAEVGVHGDDVVEAPANLGNVRLRA